MSATTTVSTYVEVEVDINEFCDEDIIAEAQRRNLHMPLTTSEKILLSQRIEMLRALWANDNARAVAILRDYLCNCLDRAVI